MTDFQNSTEQSNAVFNQNGFSSRTQLTEKEQISDDYNPFEHRDHEKGTSTAGALANFFKCSLGSGILAMPMAFYNGGLLFGLVGTLISAFLCGHCVHILVTTSQNICRKARVPALGYAETAKTVFEYGPMGLRRWSNVAKHFVDGGLMSTYFAVGCVFIIFVAVSFHNVISYNYKAEWDVRIYIAITLVPCLFIGQIRNLKYLVPFSFAANVFIVAAFSITLYYMFKEPLVFSDKPLIAEISQIPLFFATAIFAMEGIGAVLPIENSMKKPQHFLGCPGILTTAMVVVGSLYATIGFFGYVRYGSEVRGSITLNLAPGEPWADAAKLLMAIAGLFTFGLHFYVPSEILWRNINHMFDEKNHNRTQILLRTAIVLLSGSISVAVPNLEPIISLVGAVFFSLLGLFMPSVVETVYLWPDRLGWYKWKLVKNVFLCLASIFVLIAGASESIRNIIIEYSH